MTEHAQKDGVRVNCFNPGPTDTDILTKMCSQSEVLAELRNTMELCEMDSVVGAAVLCATDKTMNGGVVQIEGPNVISHVEYE